MKTIPVETGIDPVREKKKQSNTPLDRRSEDDRTLVLLLIPVVDLSPDIF